MNPPSSNQHIGSHQQHSLLSRQGGRIRNTYMYETFSLALEQTLHRDTRRAGHDAGDIIRRHALAEHGARARTLRGNLALDIGNRSITYDGAAS